jgi:hypothetical protein
LAAEELLQSKGFNPSLIQVLAVGDAATRFQSLSSGAVDVIAVGTPHDLMLRQKGLTTLAGPPEVGVPGAGVFTPDRFLRKMRSRCADLGALRAQHYILKPQRHPSLAARAAVAQRRLIPDYELKGCRDGWRATPNWRRYDLLGDKKRLDEVGFPAREA